MSELELIEGFVQQEMEHCKQSYEKENSYAQPSKFLLDDIRLRYISYECVMSYIKFLKGEIPESEVKRLGV